MRRRPTFNRKRLLIAGIFLLIVAAATLVFAEDGGSVSNMYGTFWALVPPIVAIALALITKEVYSSLFVGILVGALFNTNFNVRDTMHTMIDGGILSVLTDSWNVGIQIFVICLGIFSAVVTKAGGSAAYGRWAEKRIKSHRGATITTMVLGVLIFVDDYFNCLTVGSVMRPVTDKHNVSRAKLSYLIDSTAAPVCMISPISSWAAAVTGVIPEMDELGRFSLFLNTIPYNLYALLTLCMVLCICLMKFDYGPMKRHEDNAVKNNDLYTTPDRPYENAGEEKVNEKGRVIDIVLPVFVFLIPCCILGLMYTGGLFEGATVLDSFADCDASLGLVYGSVVGLIITFIYMMCRRVMTFTEFMECFPEGFRAMVPATLILIFAWTLSTMTGNLGGAEYVAGLVEGGAEALASFLPAIIYLVGCGLSFATGTSWGTFGILIPIVSVLFPVGPQLFVAVSACLAGAITGDHCSPISDTTIMSSAGGQCNHVNHVSTQLPYAMTCAGMCFIFYIIMGLWPSPVVTVIALAAMVALMFGIRAAVRKKEAKAAQ